MIKFLNMVFVIDSNQSMFSNIDVFQCDTSCTSMFIVWMVINDDVFRHLRCMNSFSV